MSFQVASTQPKADGPSSVPEGSITLQVGERHFTTLPSTLMRSSFFASLLSARRAGSKPNGNSYFVDADPEYFAHILGYLRREVLPIVYDKKHGFDHAFYQALEAEADYFGIEELRKWLAEKGYLRAITIEYSGQVVKGEDMSRAAYTTSIDGNTERSYYPAWGTEQVYQCPRSITVHHGNPDACGRACERAKGDGSQYVERSILRTLVVTKKIVFNGGSS